MEKINIILNDKIYKINDDTPDFLPLIDDIIHLKDLDLDSMKIISDIPEFDVDTFKNAIIESINEIINGIKIDKKEFEAKLKEIKDLNSKI